MYKRVLIVLCLIISAFIPIQSETLRFAISIKESDPLFDISQRYYNEVTRTIDGLNIKLVYRPLKRSYYELIEGEIDGDVSRIERAYANTDVIRVPVPVSSLSGTLFSHNENHNIDELMSNDYSIIVIRGSLAIVEYLEENGIIYNSVNSIEQAFKLLDTGRVDFFISDLFVKRSYDKDKIYDNVYISDEILFTIPLYVFVLKRHEKWVAKISESIKRINESDFVSTLVE